MLTNAANRHIRKLKHKSVQPHPLLLLYYSIVELMHLYALICFYNIFTVVHRYRLLKNPSQESPFPTIRPHHLRPDPLRTHHLTWPRAPAPPALQPPNPRRCRRVRLSKSLVPSRSVLHPTLSILVPLTWPLKRALGSFQNASPLHSPTGGVYST